MKGMSLQKFCIQNHMQKGTALKSASVLLIAVLISFLAWENTLQTLTQHDRILGSYQTSSSRTANVQKYCPANLDRSSLAPTADISSAQSQMNSVRSQLGIDGNALINKLVKFDIESSKSIVTANYVGLSLFVGAFAVPSIILLFIWPFLWCCCCCPGSCPSKCCQKPQSEPYTNCELKWPSTVLVFSLLLIISICAYGLVNVKLGSTFQNMGCSLAIFTDDLLNGNTTASKDSFFTGLNVFSSSLTKLSNNLTTINTTFSDLSNNSSGTSYNAVNNIATVQNNYIKKIPDNLGSAPMYLVYNTPINSAAPSSTINSAFSSLLGLWSTNETLLYNLYYSIEYARALMQGVKNSSTIFSGQISTIQSQISPIQSTLDGIISSVNSMDSNLSNLLSLMSNYSNLGNLSITIFYAFVMGFSCILLIGILCMCCCNKPGCRNMMYFACFFLFFAGVCASIIAIIFSLLVPTFTWVCDYLAVASTNSTGFQNNFGSLLGNSTVDQLSTCMPFGDGNIVNSVAGSAASGINNLTSVISSLNTFNNTGLKLWIDSNLTNLVSTANAYANGDISDLDTTNNNILAGYSDPTNTTINSGCTSFTDSWVPSNNQNSSFATAITCKSNAGTTGTLSNCDSNFGPNGVCQGCMDTTQLLTLQASALGVQNAIKTKYGASCSFASILNNTWTNYFSKKYTTLGYPTVKTQVSGSVMYRIQQTVLQINDTSINGSVFSSIDTFRGVLNSVNSGLSSIQNLTDPTYGMLAGLNCKLFGEDFTTFQNVICGSFYNNTYLIRLTFGIMVWGILFAMCCTVCSGVRYYKQIGKARGRQVSDSSIIFTKRNSFDEGSKRIFKGRNRYSDDYE